MNKKNKIEFTSPDIGKLQAVVIDLKTKIYIPLGTDPEKAKKRYLLRHESKVS